MSSRKRENRSVEEGKHRISTKTNSAPSENVSTLDISLEINNFPVIEQSTKIFEAFDSWSMFKKGDEYFLTIKPSPTGELVCLARFDRRLEKATVHCGKALVKETDDGNKAVMNPIRYPLDQFLLMYALAQRNGALFHAASVNINGRGFIFLGRSGAGKSTISQIFEAKGYALLSDDRVVIRKINGGFYAYGTPWAGDAGIANNRKLPLGGLFFIRQSLFNRIEEITPIRAVELLMPVTSIPWFDENGMSGILMFCEDVVLNVPAYELHFTTGDEIVNIFEEFVSRR